MNETHIIKYINTNEELNMLLFLLIILICYKWYLYYLLQMILVLFDLAFETHMMLKVGKNAFTPYANREGPDESEHPCSLIVDMYYIVHWFCCCGSSVITDNDQS